MLQCYDPLPSLRGVSTLHTDASGTAPPDSFGPFRVLHQIGVGVLGPVFRAYQPDPGRLVAVKQFRLDIPPESAHRFVAALERLIAADLTHLRPKLLAREWNVLPRPVIEACLAAVRAGLLTMKWDLLCDNCRAPKLTVGALAELPSGAHCPSCNIDYGRDFARNVEATFRPAPSIRVLAPGGYCLASPLATENVAMGEDRRLSVKLAPAGGFAAELIYRGE